MIIKAPDSTQEMRPIARVFIGLTAALGFGALTLGFVEWQSLNPLQFLVYLIMALVTSGWKVTLPGLHGTLSANYLYVLLGIIDLSLGETLFLGCSSVFLQCFWRRKTRVKFIKLLFNVSSTACSILIATQVYHWEVFHQIGVGFPLRLCAAAIFYFISNSGSIAIVIAMTERRNVLEIWRTAYFWSFPYYLVGAAVAEIIRVVSTVVGWQSTVVIPAIIYFVYRSYSQYLKRLESEKDQADTQRRQAEDLAGLHLRTIEALALAIEAKDQTTQDHLRRMQIYCIGVARELGLDDNMQQALVAAALLHDIGKLAVPEHIISKPGKLTPEEFERMKIHPVVGAEILDRVQFPYPVADIVRRHHEKWNGTGYPDGLKGENIPIGARILSAVDCLDALASDRQYRRALPLVDAMEYVRQESGKSFEPRIVEILSTHYQEWEAKARGSRSDWFHLSTEKMDFNEVLDKTTETSPEVVETEQRNEPPAPAEFFQRIAEARQEAQTLFEVAQDLVNSLSLDETLSVLTLRLKRLVPHDSLAVFVRKKEEVVCEFATGDEARIFSALRIPVGQGLSGWVVENDSPILNGNPSVELGYLNDPLRFSILHSALAVPLKSGNEVVGVLALYSGARDAFSKDHLRILQAVSSKLAQAIENCMRLQRAEGDATTDFLTGLPNARSLFLHLNRELEEASKLGDPVSILVCDLDGFKAVNDKHGHLAGNQVLQLVSRSLKERCRANDYVARMGGDEFVIVLPGITGLEAGEIGERFRRGVEQATMEAGITGVSMSVGISQYPIQGTQPEELLSEADQHMYVDKQDRKQKALVNLMASVQESSTVKVQ